MKTPFATRRVRPWLGGLACLLMAPGLFSWALSASTPNPRQDVNDRSLPGGPQGETFVLGSLQIHTHPVPISDWPPDIDEEYAEVSIEQWNTWQQQLEARRIPPAHLTSIGWQCEFNPTEFLLQGDVCLSVDVAADSDAELLIPLGEFSPAIVDSGGGATESRAAWIDKSGNVIGPAVVGNLPDGRLAVVAATSGQVALRAALAGHGDPLSAIRFEIQLPDAPRRTLVVQTPEGWEPRLDAHTGIIRAKQRDSETATPGTDWTILAPPSGPFSLAFVNAAAEADRAIGEQVTAREEVYYRIDPSGVLFEADWLLRAAGGWPAAIVFDHPPSLELIAVSAAGRPLAFETITTDDAPQAVAAGPMPVNSVRVNLPPDIVDGAAPNIQLTVTAISRADFAGRVALPRLIPRNVRWESGAARVQLHPDWRLSDIELRDAVLSSLTASVAEGNLEVDLLRPHAEIHIAVDSREQDSPAVLETLLTTSASGLVARTLVTVAGTHGSPRELVFPITEGWVIEEAPMTAGIATGTPALPPVSWRVASSPEAAGRRLVVSLDPRQIATEDVVIQVTARMPAQVGDSWELATVLPVRHSGGDGANESFLVFAQSEERGRLTISDSRDVRHASREELSDSAVGALAAMGARGPAMATPPRVFGFNAATMARLTWVEDDKAPAMGVEIIVDALGPSMLERFRFADIPTLDAEELLLRIHPRRPDAQWTWQDNRDRDIDARRLTESESAERGLSLADDYWVIGSLPDDVTEITTIRTTQNAELPFQVGLAAAVGVESQRGAVHIELPPHAMAAITEMSTVPDVSSQSDEKGTQAAANSQSRLSGCMIAPEWPERRHLPRAAGIARYSFSPTGLNGERGLERIMIQRRQASRGSTTSLEDLPSNPSTPPLVLREWLTCSMSSQGHARCVATCEIAVGDDSRLEFRLPVGSKLIEVRQGEIALAWSEDDGNVTARLSSSPLPAVVQIRYDVEGPAFGLVTEMAAPWLSFPSPPIERRATLDLPSGFGIESIVEAGGKVQVSESNLARRMLGAQAQSDPIEFLPHIKEGQFQAADQEAFESFFAAVQAILGPTVERPAAVNIDDWELLKAIETQLAASSTRLVMDASAIGDWNWSSTTTPWRQPRPEDLRSATMRWLDERGAVVVRLDDRRIGLTSLAALARTPHGFLRDRESPLFVPRLPQSSDSWHGRFLTVDQWREMTSWQAAEATSWRDVVNRELQKLDLRAAYTLSGTTPAVVVADRLGQTRLGFVVLLLSAVVGWWLAEKNARLAISAVAALIVICLIVPSSLAALFAGAPAAFLAGIVIARLLPRWRGVIKGWHRVWRVFPGIQRPLSMVLVAVLLSMLLAPAIAKRPTTGASAHHARHLEQDAALAARNADDDQQRQPSPRPVQDEPMHGDMYFPVDDEGNPVDGPVAVTSELQRAIEAEWDLKTMRPRNYLLGQAAYRFREAQLADSQNPAPLLVASFRFLTFDDQTTVHLPVDRAEFSVPPLAYNLTTDHELSLMWEAAGAAFVLSGAGWHDVEVTLLPVANTAQGQSQISVSIPTAAASDVEIIHAENEGPNHRRFRIERPRGQVQVDLGAGRSSGPIGPARRLDLVAGARTQPVNSINAEILTWLQVNRDVPRFVVKMILIPTGDVPETLRFRVPEAHAVLNATVNGAVARAVAIDESFANMTNVAGLQAYSLDIPAGVLTSADGQVVAELVLGLPHPVPFGRWEMPTIEIESANITQRWACSGGQQSTVQTIQAEELEETAVEEFALTWESSNLSSIVPPELAFRPRNANSRWVVGVQPRASRTEFRGIQTVVVAGPRRALLRHHFSFQSEPGKLVWRLDYPVSSRVKNVTILNQQEQSILAHWSQTDDTLVMFCREASRAARVTIEAEQTWTTPPAGWDVPSPDWPDAAPVPREFDLWSLPGVQVDVVAPLARSLSDALPRSPPIPRARRAGSYLLSPGAAALRVSLEASTISQRTMAFAGQLTTRIRYVEGRWLATVVLAADDWTAAPEEMLLKIPDSWRRVDDGGAFVMPFDSSESDAGFGVVAVRWPPLSAAAAQAAIELEFAIPDPLASGVRPATVVLPEAMNRDQAGAFNQTLLVPKFVAQRPIEWITVDLAASTFSATANRQRRLAERKYRVDGPAPAATGRLLPRGTGATVSYAIAEFASSMSQYLCAEYTLLPQGLSSVAFDVPTGMRVLDVRIGGLPTPSRVNLDGHLQIELFSSIAPQRVALTLALDSVAALETPRPVDVPLEDVFWLTEADARQNDDRALAGENLLRLSRLALQSDLATLESRLPSDEVRLAAARNSIWSRLQAAVGSVALLSDSHPKQSAALREVIAELAAALDDRGLRSHESSATDQAGAPADQFAGLTFSHFVNGGMVRTSAPARDVPTNNASANNVSANEAALSAVRAMAWPRWITMIAAGLMGLAVLPMPGRGDASADSPRGRGLRASAVVLIVGAWIGLAFDAWLIGGLTAASGLLLVALWRLRWPVPAKA